MEESQRNGVCKVFLSYNPNDAKLARSLRDMIVERTTGHADLLMSGEIRDKSEWRQQAKDHMKDAKWFIMIKSNSSPELDWCLYEAGLYRALNGDNGHLVCLHDPNNKPPEVLGDCQSVINTPENLEALLEDFDCVK